MSKNNFMLQFALQLAESMPKEMIVDMIQNEINQYKKDPSDGNWTTLVACCELVAMKRTVENEGGTEKLLNKIDAIKDGYDLMKRIHPEGEEM